MLTRDQILAAEDHTYEVVDVPEWGGKVKVRGMSGTERDRFELGMAAHKDNLEALAGLRGRVVAWCTLDENGRQLFTQDDAKRLGAKSAGALDRVYDAVLRISRVSEKAAAAAEADFTGGQSGSSTSAWPDTSASPSENSSPGALPPSSPNGSPTSGSPEHSAPNGSTF